MKYDDYTQINTAKRRLAGMKARGEIFAFKIESDIAGDWVYMKFIAEQDWVLYKVREFLKALKRGLISVHGDVYRNKRKA